MADVNNTHLSPLRDENGDIIDPSILVLNEELVSGSAQLTGTGTSGSKGTHVSFLRDELGNPLPISVYNEELISGLGNFTGTGTSGSKGTHLSPLLDEHGLPIPDFNGNPVLVNNEQLISGPGLLTGTGRYIKVDPSALPRRVIAGTSKWDAFEVIRPGDVDIFVFDFTKELGENIILSAVWDCTVAETSVLTDVDASTRVLGPVRHTDTVTFSRVGEMLDGVTYDLTATIITTDDRVLSYSASVQCIVAPDIQDTDLNKLARDEFRALFPQFDNEAQYTDQAIDYWISQAAGSLDPVRWGQFYDQGLRLYVAHMLAINYRSTRKGGALVGSGVISSKSVGGVSLGYDNQFGMEDKAGSWGLTIWGNQFIRLARLAGSGPIQL